MADKGKLVVEGAKFYCTNSADHNSPGTAATLNVMSQKKALKANKYFAHDKPIGTYLDDKATSFDNGQGFGKCITPDGKQMPCAAKCSIKYTDYYENVEFNKSMKILLDVSTGTCPGYGKKGDIKIADSGQKEKTSSIKVNEKDAFEVNAVSGQWPVADKSAKTSVKGIKASVPYAANAGETLYYLDHKNNFSFEHFMNFSETKLRLDAEYSGDESKIVWGLFKGTDTKDKVQTFIGLGKSIDLHVEKIFKNLDEGKYRVEAYGSKPGDAKCAIFIDYIKNFVEKITTPGDSVLKGIPMPFSLKFKVDPNDPKAKILNKTIFQAPSSVIWTVSDGKNILYKTGSVTGTNVVKVNGSGSSASIAFNNAGKYKVSATTNEEGKPFTKDVTVESKLGIKSISHGDALLRVSGTVTAKVANYNVAYVGNAPKTVQWYLKKGATRVAVFEQSPTSQTSAISKKVTELLSNDAKLTGALYGNYILEAYAAALPDGKNPDFTESGAYLDCYHFEVVRNSVTGANLPETIPLNAKVKFTADTRLPLANGEKVITEPEGDGVTKNEDGSLTFTKEGEYTINLYMEGGDSDPVKIAKKVKVAAPEIKRALWSYESGYKRTETGYKEDSYGFIEVAGLAKQKIIAKVWLKGPDDSFYADTEKKFFLEEKPITLSDQGKGSFKINTKDDYKTKIEKAIPPTAENPNPPHQLIFTIELVAAEGASVILPADLAIKNARAVDVQGKVLYEVLESNEVLALTSEKKIKSIVFSDEAGKDIQRSQTFYGKTHKIWVHTVNMTEDELQVNVYKEIPDKAMTEKEGTVSALTSKKNYPPKKVGASSMLKMDFTPDKAWNDPEKKNVDFYFASVSKKGKDDSGKDILIPVKSQVTLTNVAANVQIVNAKDFETVGLKAKKDDGTPFTNDEMVKLRKEYLFYENGCLKVSSTTAQEVIENDISPVIVEMAEIKATKDCYCDKAFTEDQLKDLIKTMTGKEDIWKGIKDPCPIDDKSLKSLTYEVNAMFKKYNINRCMQKITFLANLYAETGFFVQSIEEKSSHLSSQSTYKGRGILQITGIADDTKYYNIAGPYKTYGKYIGKEDEVVTNPDFLGTKLHYAIDVGGWVFSEFKEVPKWDKEWKGDNAKYDHLRIEKKKRFEKGLGKSLNELGRLAEDDEKYFWLQAKMLNGYSPSNTLSDNPIGWKEREDGFKKLKTWFKFDKSVCDHEYGSADISGRAPWMALAVKIAKEMKGCEESNEPMYSKAKSYLRYCNNSFEPTDGVNGPWCAAFMNWCIGQTINPQSSEPYMHAKSAASLAPLDTVAGKNYKKIDDPVFGCLVVYKHSSEWKGHTGFLYGKTKQGAYILLGGNQDQTVKFSSYGEYTSNSGTKKLYGFYIPADYTITENDKLTEADTYDDGDKSLYNDGDIINAKFGITTGKNGGATN